MIDKLRAEELLSRLQTNLSDLRGALVTTLDGIAVAALNIDRKSNQLAAMTATSLGLSQRIIDTIEGAGLSEISIASAKGNVFVYSVGTKAALVIVTKETPNVALINWESRKIAEALAELGFR